MLSFRPNFGGARISWICVGLTPKRPCTVVRFVPTSGMNIPALVDVAVPSRTQHLLKLVSCPPHANGPQKLIFSELVQCSPDSVPVNKFCVHCMCRLDSFLGNLEFLLDHLL